MQRLILLCFTMVGLSFILYRPVKDKVVLNRIEYIFNLRFIIDREVWQGLADKKFDLPLVYYTHNACYIANPTERFLFIYKPKLVFKNKDLKIYQTPLLDSVPFHMETGLTFGDSTADYNYKSPFMNCSSFEITQKTIPDVNSTEQWATMVLHEYFHGFQFKHAQFIKYFEKSLTPVSEDSLRKIYNAQAWFKESVDKENNILLAAISSSDRVQIHKLISTFFEQREQRYRQTRQQLHLDIQPIEQTYETMEGTARYVEFSLYSRFATKAPDFKLTKTDTSYQAYQYFQKFQFEEEGWLFLTSKTSYFYATGFNMVRLLDKLEISYKSRLFNEAELTLAQLLKLEAQKNNK